MPFYQKGDVRIRYEETGSGFPLLVTPGGGLNSRVSNWQTAVINAMEEFKHDFRCITMDQRNAIGGESTGPVPDGDAWEAFADDQLGLMDHLGIREFFYMGYCIGGCFAGRLMQQAPERVVAAVFCQTVGYRPDDPDAMLRHSQQNWLDGFRARRPDVPMETNRSQAARAASIQISLESNQSCRGPRSTITCRAITKVINAPKPRKSKGRSRPPSSWPMKVQTPRKARIPIGTLT